MNFIAPEFLYALGFLAIPILIHLFNFRRYKTVKFSQVRFLKSIQKKTKSTSQLKHILVLLSRCLAIAALVLAFAQPYLADDSQKVTKGKQGVIIYLDNSYSLQANAEVGSLLDLGKNKAIAIIEAFSDADKFQLHTNEFSGKQQRWLNKDAFLNELQSINYSPIFRSYNDVFSRLQQIDNDEEYSLKRYLISDLQKINLDITSFSDSVLYHFIPVQSKVSENAWINRVSSFQPFHLNQQAEELNITVKVSDIDAEKSFNGSLMLNNRLKSPFSIRAEKDSINEKINYINPDDKLIKGTAILKDFPVTFDDTFHFSYSMQTPIAILHLFEETPNKNITTLYTNDSIINYYTSSIQQVDYSQLKSTSLLILDGVNSLSSGAIDEFIKFHDNGGSVAIFPSSSMETSSFNSFLSAIQSGIYKTYNTDTIDVTELNTEAQLFKNVFEVKPKRLNLPRANAYWKIQSPVRSLKEDVMLLRNNDAFLTLFESKKGSTYLFASGLLESQSNLDKHALFVPTLFNMALQSVKPTPIAYHLDDKSISIGNISQEETPIRIVNKYIEVIPKQFYKDNEVELFLGNSIDKAGHYYLVRGSDTLKNIAINYGRKESHLNIYTVTEFKEKLAQLGISNRIITDAPETLSSSIESKSIGQQLWKYFIVLALLFLGLEILFLRILK